MLSRKLQAVKTDAEKKSSALKFRNTAFKFNSYFSCKAS